LGITGLVQVSGKGFFYQQFTEGTKNWTQAINRSSIVFYELSENFQRGHFHQPYETPAGTGAHHTAVMEEGHNFNVDNPGNGKFYPLK
jgi:hypothetical protein